MSKLNPDLVGVRYTCLWSARRVEINNRHGKYTGKVDQNNFLQNARVADADTTRSQSHTILRVDPQVGLTGRVAQVAIELAGRSCR